MEVKNFKDGKRLRVTCILPVYWPAIGGCELHTHELVRRLIRKHRVDVVTLIDKQEEKGPSELWVSCLLKAPKKVRIYREDNMQVIKPPLTFLEKLKALFWARIQSPRLPDGIVRWAMEKLSDLYMKKLMKLMKGTEIVHCVHGGVSYLGYAALKAARHLGVPFVYTPVLHVYDKDWGQKTKEGRRGETRTEYNPQLQLIPRGWADHFWYKLCQEADALIAMTDFERHFFIQRGILEDKISTVGVAPLVSGDASVDVHQKYGLAQQKIVLFLGRNVGYKGIEEILKAAQMVWPKHPETCFVFAGPLEGDSKEIFLRYQDSRIKTLGRVSEDEKAALLKACHVFCMPSQAESLGGTFLEAWSYGKPIIGAKIPPLKELTHNGEGGFLINPLPDEIAEKISVLLADPDMRHRMGQWGKQRVLEHYNWETVTKKVESVYERLLSSAQNVA